LQLVKSDSDAVFVFTDLLYCYLPKCCIAIYLKCCIGSYWLQFVGTIEGSTEGASKGATEGANEGALERVTTGIKQKLAVLAFNHHNLISPSLFQSLHKSGHQPTYH